MDLLKAKVIVTDKVSIPSTSTSTTSSVLASTVVHLFKGTLNENTHQQTQVNTLCFIGLHSTTSAQEFISTLHPFTPSHIRLVNAHPDRYIVLVKCNSEQECKEMFERFSQTSELNLTVLIVDKVSFGLNVDPFCFPLQYKDCIELPTCPVCLDRMDDSVTGIVTTLCQHSFHVKCLEKWQDSSCPVCRFTHQSHGPANECIECSTEDNLWICLICGKIGCGRYKAGHAENHFKQTNHNYALEMETQRVWDYIGEEYVHRLVQNKADGKLVETDSDKQDKFDSTAHIVMEYTHLLSSQMESQREFYEDQLETTQSELTSQINSANLLLNKESLLLHAAEQKNTQSIARIEKLVKRVGQSQKEREDEESINQILREDQAALKEKILKLERVLRVKDEQVNELQEQVRDLMFFVESREKVGNDPELINATIVSGGTEVKKGKR